MEGEEQVEGEEESENGRDSHLVREGNRSRRLGIRHFRFWGKLVFGEDEQMREMQIKRN